MIVGFITGRAVGRELHLHNIAVHPDHQGQGIGRKLMEAADAYCAEGDFQCITLEVRTDNDIACRLYLSLGFTAVGTRKDHYGPGQDAHLYTKKVRRD
ncbi:MAG: ribosomal protein S18-alanine N-acetyltransferase [Candidatus Neomarinimicrobiota bacterium]